MNYLLIFFALPVATVILSIVFQKILKNPLLVAATFFAIYLIVTFAAFDASFLVYAILYTILAYVTAVLTKVICRLINIFLTQNENCPSKSNCGRARISERPITINNTSPCTSINLASEANLLTASNNTPMRRNNCCNCCRRMN